MLACRGSLKLWLLQSSAVYRQDLESLIVRPKHTVLKKKLAHPKDPKLGKNCANILTVQLQ